MIALASYSQPWDYYSLIWVDLGLAEGGAKPSSGSLHGDGVWRHSPLARSYIGYLVFEVRVIDRPRLLCSKFYLLCFWAVLKNVAYYAQYYAHNHCNYAIVCIQFYYFNDYISIVRLQPVVSFTLCYAAMLLYLAYYAQYYAHEKTCALFCTKLWVITILQMKIVIYLHRLHWSFCCNFHS